jgi:signal transduction histidine kinase
LGRNYLLQEKYENALQYFNTAMYLDTQAAKNNSPLLQGIGGASFKLGHYDVAEKKYKAALLICEREGLLTDRLTLYHTLGEIYYDTKRYQLAYSHQLAFSNLYDSLYKEKIIRATNEVETKYRVSEKDKELALKQVLLVQQQGRIKEKNIWIICISGGAILLIFLLSSLYKNKRNKEQLQKEIIHNLKKEKEINALKAKIEGEEEERTRLARDLHDGVVVKFSAVKMNLSVLPEQHPELTDASDFKKIIGNLDQATQELRKTAHNLMPDALLEGGLSEAAFYFCKDLEQSSGVTIDFQQFVELPRLLPTVELSLYRVIQELLQNVVKHAKATRALVQLSHNEHLLNITIEDNGEGFHASSEMMANGIGVRNIYARMTAMNGQVDIESREGAGTTAYLELDTRNYLARGG